MVMEKFQEKKNQQYIFTGNLEKEKSNTGKVGFFSVFCGTPFFFLSFLELDEIIIIIIINRELLRIIYPVNSLALTYIWMVRIFFFFFAQREDMFILKERFIYCTYKLACFNSETD